MVQKYIKPRVPSELRILSHESVNSNSCRDEARTSLLRAVEMPIGRDRSLLECRAAAWSMRADQLQRQEERSAAYLSYSLAEREAEHVRL